MVGLGLGVLLQLIPLFFQGIDFFLQGVQLAPFPFQLFLARGDLAGDDLQGFLEIIDFIVLFLESDQAFELGLLLFPFLVLLRSYPAKFMFLMVYASECITLNGIFANLYQENH